MAYYMLIDTEAVTGATDHVKSAGAVQDTYTLLRKGTRNWTLENYETVLGAEGGLPPPGFARSFINTIVITVPSTVLPVAIEAFAAFGIVWLGFRGRNLAYPGAISLLVIPLQVTWAPVLKILDQLNLTGEFYVHDMTQQLAEVEPDVLKRFGVDVVDLDNRLK